MGPIAGAHFRDDIFDMGFDRFLADGECPGNQLVRVATGDQLQYFDLARGQGRVAGIVGDLERDLRLDALHTRMNGPDDVGEILANPLFEHITERARFERPRCQSITRESGEHHDARLGRFEPDRSHGVNTAHEGHLQIHNRYVRLQSLELLDGLTAVAGLTDDRQVQLTHENRGDSFAQHRVVIDYQDTHQAGRSLGRRVT